MKKLTKYFLIAHTALLLITGFGMWFILKRFFPEILIDTYFIVPLFFYILGLIFIYRFRRASINKPKEMVNVYMIMRMIKIFTAAVTLLIYWIVDKENIRSFAIIFIIFYVINLIWETYIYMRMEMYFKYKNDLNKSTQERIDQ
jgi:hypothetical protein